jgi:hypothetical protein
MKRILFLCVILVITSIPASAEMKSKPIAELEALAERGDLDAVFWLAHRYGLQKDRKMQLQWLKRGAEIGGATELHNYAFVLRRDNPKEADKYREAASGVGDFDSFTGITDDAPEMTVEQRKIKFLRRLIEAQHPDSTTCCAELLKSALLAGDRESLMLGLITSLERDPDPAAAHVSALRHKIANKLSSRDQAIVKRQFAIEKKNAK